MSDKYWIEYLERKSPLNYDEYLENRIAELEAENQRLRCTHDWRVVDAHSEDCTKCGESRMSPLGVELGC